MLMRCENCGAPQEFGAADQVAQCDYCGQTNFVERPGETRSRATPERCPGCGNLLFGARAAAHSIWGCGGCGGVWLDVAACNQVAQGDNVEFFELARRANQNAVARVSEPGTPRQCPVCDERMAMTRRLHGWVKLDACGQHGTFFDAGELEEVCYALRTLPPPPKLAQPTVKVWHHTPVTEAELAAFKGALRKPALDAETQQAFSKLGDALLRSLVE